MTAVNDEMRRLMRESLPELNASADPKALIAIKDMAPHYMSREKDLPTNGLAYMFPVELDGEQLHVYLKEH